MDEDNFIYHTRSWEGKLIDLPESHNIIAWHTLSIAVLVIIISVVIVIVFIVVFMTLGKPDIGSVVCSIHWHIASTMSVYVFLFHLIESLKKISNLCKKETF